MSSDMNGDTGTKKLWARLAEMQGWDKVVLTGLFAVSLVIAHLIVVSRSAIVLSGPIELPYSGLSIRVPVGNGWKSNAQWKYQNNYYLLKSDFNLSSREPAIQVICRYFTAAEKITPRVWFEQQASAIGSSIVETGSLTCDTLTIDWVHIEKTDLMLCIFLGIAELPGNRILHIEVHQFAGQALSAQQLFNKIVENLKFKDNQLLTAGSEVVTAIGNMGISSLLAGQNRQSCFFVKDASGKNIGFTIDTINSSTEANSQFDIQASGYINLKGQTLNEQRTAFRAADNLKSFIWRSETSRNFGRSTAEVSLNEAGAMTVRTLFGVPDSRNYMPGPAAIPDIFLEMLFGRILEGNIGKIVFDMIDCEGNIIPTYAEITEINPPGATQKNEYAYTITLKLLDDSGTTERIYFDGDRHIVKIIMQQKQKYILESTDIRQLINAFPDFSDLISQIGRLPRGGNPEISI
jgi:hypothetical protein